MLTSKGVDLQASGIFKLPTLAAEAVFTGVHGKHPVMQRKPNPDQIGTVWRLARRIPVIPTGFVHLMLPLR